MMTRQEALDFARSSALTAFDQRGEYDDAAGSFRDNVRDTLCEEKAAQYEEEAFAGYDAEVARLFGIF